MSARYRANSLASLPLHSTAGENLIPSSLLCIFFSFPQIPNPNFIVIPKTSVVLVDYLCIMQFGCRICYLNLCRL